MGLLLIVTERKPDSSHRKVYQLSNETRLSMEGDSLWLERPRNEADNFADKTPSYFQTTQSRSIMIIQDGVCIFETINGKLLPSKAIGGGS